MATIAGKSFVSMSAEGTDSDPNSGEDYQPEKWVATYNAVDDIGIPYVGVKIPGAIHNAGDDAAINAALEEAIS